MKNRYGKEYWFEKVDKKTYRFHMEEDGTKWIRFGGKEGQTVLDYNDLGMFDPAGGPFVSVGSSIYWNEIKGAGKRTKHKTVDRIRSTEEGIFVEVN